jgi:hypothetical protein
MKQTAVEWLLNEWPILKSELPHWLIEQAKEMEKSELEKAWAEGFIKKTNRTFKQYYNETYGGDR